MDNGLQKTINEYNEWRDKLRKVVDDNFDLLVEIIEGSYGLNYFLRLKEENRMMQNIIIEGLVLNKNILTGDYYLWFYSNNIFYLIERTKNNMILNISPNIDIIRSNINFSLPYSSQKAGVEEEINFLISFMEWTPYFEKELKNRMKSLNSINVEERIKSLGSIRK